MGARRPWIELPRRLGGGRSEVVRAVACYGALNECDAGTPWKFPQTQPVGRFKVGLNPLLPCSPFACCLSIDQGGKNGATLDSLFDRDDDPGRC